MKLATKLSIATASIALSFAAVSAKPAEAAFVGAYDPDEWEVVNTNANGFVNTAAAPNFITLVGGDNGSFLSGTTDYVIQAIADGVLSFNWSYFTVDPNGAVADPFSFLNNGVATLVFGSGNNGGGDFSTTVKAGDIFGFRVATTDNIFGRGGVRISNFSAPDSASVPEPLTIAGSAIALGFGAWMKRKQAGVANKA